MRMASRSLVALFTVLVALACGGGFEDAMDEFADEMEEAAREMEQAAADAERAAAEVEASGEASGDGGDSDQVCCFFRRGDGSTDLHFRAEEECQDVVEDGMRLQQAMVVEDDRGCELYEGGDREAYNEYLEKYAQVMDEEQADTEDDDDEDRSSADRGSSDREARGGRGDERRSGARRGGGRDGSSGRGGSRRGGRSR